MKPKERVFRLVSALRSLIDQPQHCAHAHAELPSNAPDAGPRGTGGHDRRDLAGIGVLDPSASQLGTVGLGPAQ
jgi:hypothetical protein